MSREASNTARRWLDIFVERYDSLEEQLEALRSEMQFINNAALSFHKGEEGKARALNVIATRSSAALNPATRLREQADELAKSHEQNMTRVDAARATLRDIANSAKRLS